MKKTIVTVFMILFSIALLQAYYKKPSDEIVLKRCKFIIKGKVLKAYPASRQSHYDMGKQDLDILVEESFFGELKPGDVIRTRINFMKKAMYPVFKRSFSHRRVKGKEYLMFLGGGTKGYFKPVYGPHSFLPWKKSLMKRFNFPESLKNKTIPWKAFDKRTLFTGSGSL